MKTDEQLWYEVSENLSELSRRDKVKFKVTASPESVKKNYSHWEYFEDA